MRRLNGKMSLVIIAYSIILTSVFILGVSWFQYSANTVEDIPDNSYVYPLNDEEFLSIYQGNSTQLDSSQIVESSNQYQEYVQFTMHQMVPFIVVFTLFLIGSSILLWIILNALQNKQVSAISQKFQNVKEDEYYDFQNPQLNAAYMQIKENFQGYLNDYKRLNSYLSHEQKNAIAVLRTTMEVKHQTEYLPQLDYISSSIDDILTLSEQGDESSLQIVDVTLCCAEICDLYRKSYPQLIFDFDPDHTCEIEGKQRWIMRALSNLIDNAIKYGEQKPIHVSVTHKHHSVIIRVQDHGIGMDEQQLASIFQYRYRISELQQNGYGIGLSLISHVCDLCGGYAYVESKLQEGSTFYLSFPAYEESH